MTIYTEANSDNIDLRTVTDAVCPITGRILAAGEGLCESRGWNATLNRPAWVVVAPEAAEEA